MRGSDKMEDRHVIATSIRVPGIDALGMEDTWGKDKAAMARAMKGWEDGGKSGGKGGARDTEEARGALDRMHVAAIFDGHRGYHAASFAARNLTAVVKEAAARYAPGW